MEDDEAELRNPFPSPPSHYVKYTSHNLNLLALLKERSDDQGSGQFEVLRDQANLPDWPLTHLEKPRVDWILEEAEPYYEVYGERWPLKDVMPSLKDIGGYQVYPEDQSIDRRPALRSALRSLLVTYSTLTASLLAPPPSIPDTAPEWCRYAEWIDVMAQNMMFSANELRPIQARANLEGMMRRQIELRREETVSLHSKCDFLETKLAEFRTMARDTTHNQAYVSKQSLLATSTSLKEDKPAHSLPITHVDVLQWAEEAC